MVSLRPARPGDEEAIRDVVVQAFPTTDEASLVAELRADGDLLLEWVAEHEGRIVGMIQYSLLILERDGITEDGRAAALAPVAVLPAHQGHGIGSRLIHETLEELRSDPWLDAIVVLGHADYYPRFGFSAEVAARGLIDPFDAGPAFMAMALRPDALSEPKARPIYARAFDLG